VYRSRKEMIVLGTIMEFKKEPVTLAIVVSTRPAFERLCSALFVCIACIMQEHRYEHFSHTRTRFLVLTWH
jgi:hypothetical protein